MVKQVVKRGDPLLIRPSERVGVGESVTTVIDDLWDTLKSIQSLYNFKRGSGISAPQIGTLKRISIVEYGDNKLTLINPKIIKHSSEVMSVSEGCLSFFDYRGKVSRYRTVLISYIDEHGEDKTTWAKEDNFSSLIQHEIDHLDGILYEQRLAEGEKLRRVEGMPSIP